MPKTKPPHFHCVNISIIAVLLEHSDPSYDNCHMCPLNARLSLPHWQVLISECNKWEFASQAKSKVCNVKCYVFFGATTSFWLSFNLLCFVMVVLTRKKEQMIKCKNIKNRNYHLFDYFYSKRNNILKILLQFGCWKYIEIGLIFIN